MRIALALVLLAGTANTPPVIQDETGDCFKPGERPRICAHIVDDKAVARARVFFRAGGGRGFYWTDMLFDGARYCTTLPRPSVTTGTAAVDYYLEAVDDEFEAARTRSRTIEGRSACPLTMGDPAAPPTPTYTTVPRQDPAPEGFDPATVKPMTPSPSPPADR